MLTSPPSTASVIAFISPAAPFSSFPKRRRSQKLSKPYACSKPSQPSVAESALILSWNVSSLGSLLRQDPRCLVKLTSEYSPAIFCLQQTKILEGRHTLFYDVLPEYEYKIFSNSRRRFAHSGTAIFSKPRPMISQREVRHTTLDKEGRFIMLEYPAVIVATVFPPRSTVLNKADMRRQWDRRFRKVVHQVRRLGKPLVIVGDLDICRPDPRSTDHEQRQLQQSFEDTLETCGLIDISVPHPRVPTDDPSSSLKQPFDRVLVSEDALPAVLGVEVLHHLQHKHHCPMLLHLHPALLAYDDAHMAQFGEAYFK